MKKRAWGLWYSGLGLHQLVSRPTFFILRWTTHLCILYQMCDAHGVGRSRCPRLGQCFHVTVMPPCPMAVVSLCQVWLICVANGHADYGSSGHLQIGTWRPIGPLTVAQSRHFWNWETAVLNPHITTAFSMTIKRWPGVFLKKCIFLFRDCKTFRFMQVNW